ncbi:hypothetical protein PHLGIDRAFT_12065 [Phlebiopsis gigantea 11061_1 CR5-6]|uniref:Uncharacterized protein n=1 Tax=Phlebiopsis gigantea (strain 11061_1 CR5-6) TaxID=745531 RepID=A0A0C3SD01_PHLG1|nr:hypothetical protein PHLGIDRAFT_12065 [Phlebiopsis gigantea 11061_1 CR5-6]
MTATAMTPISLSPGMQLLPRGDDNVDIAPYSTGIGRRWMTLYMLADGSMGVPLSHALNGSTACEAILHASKPFNDGSLQKHTLSINIESYGIFNVQKYAYNTKANSRRGKTYAEIAKQVAQTVEKFFKQYVNYLAPEHNKLGLGGPGLRFEDLYLVALVPLEKHKRMYECVLGYQEIINDPHRHPWSERYPGVFMSQRDDIYRDNLSASTHTPLEYAAADQPSRSFSRYDNESSFGENPDVAYSPGFNSIGPESSRNPDTNPPRACPRVAHYDVAASHNQVQKESHPVLYQNHIQGHNHNLRSPMSALQVSGNSDDCHYTYTLHPGGGPQANGSSQMCHQDSSSSSDDDFPIRQVNLNGIDTQWASSSPSVCEEPHLVEHMFLARHCDPAFNSWYTPT